MYTTLPEQLRESSNTYRKYGERSGDTAFSSSCCLIEASTTTSGLTPSILFSVTRAIHSLATSAHAVEHSVSSIRQSCGASLFQISKLLGCKRQANLYNEELEYTQLLNSILRALLTIVCCRCSKNNQAPICKAIHTRVATLHFDITRRFTL